MMGCNPFFLGFSDYTNKNSIKVCFTVHIFVLTEKNGTRQMIVYCDWKNIWTGFSWAVILNDAQHWFNDKRIRPLVFWKIIRSLNKNKYLIHMKYSFHEPIDCW